MVWFLSQRSFQKRPRFVGMAQRPFLMSKFHEGLRLRGALRNRRLEGLGCAQSLVLCSIKKPKLDPCPPVFLVCRQNRFDQREGVIEEALLPHLCHQAQSEAR